MKTRASKKTNCDWDLAFAYVLYGVVATIQININSHHSEGKSKEGA